MKTDIIQKNIIARLTFEFSILIQNYCEELEKSKKFVLSNQLLKSGTSIGANVWEAQNSESKDDFVHKFKIAAKEMDEAAYWLMICKHSNSYPDVTNLLSKLETISRIITKLFQLQKTKESLLNKFFTYWLIS